MTLETSYTFTDPDSHTEGSSEYQWLISGEEDGEYTELEGETRRNLALKEEWEDQYLKFRVTPVDQYAMAGEALESSAAGPVDLNLVGDPGFDFKPEGPHRIKQRNCQDRKNRVADDYGSQERIL